MKDPRAAGIGTCGFLDIAATKNMKEFSACSPLAESRPFSEVSLSFAIYWTIYSWRASMIWVCVMHASRPFTFSLYISMNPCCEVMYS